MNSCCFRSDLSAQSEVLRLEKRVCFWEIFYMQKRVQKTAFPSAGLWSLSAALCSEAEKGGKSGEISVRGFKLTDTSCHSCTDRRPSEAILQTNPQKSFLHPIKISYDPHNPRTADDRATCFSVSAEVEQRTVQVKISKYKDMPRFYQMIPKGWFNQGWHSFKDPINLS